MNYLIIGASAAGISAIEAIRSVDKNGKITVVSDENYPIYSRCLLSYYLAGMISEEKLKYRENDFFEKNNVKAILGKSVGAVIPSEKKIKLSDDSVLQFDKLLIATGSRSKMENIPGIELEGVFGLRNISDAKKIENCLLGTKTAVMLGGGLIGLRGAYALHKRGVHVSVVVKSNYVLSQMLDENSAMFVQREIEQKGIKVITGLSAKQVIGNKNVSGVILENGTKIDCEIVIIGKGVQPNIELVSGSQIKTDYGIVVDDYMKTSVADIFAAGDVAKSSDLLTGEKTINALWPNAVVQGKIAGLNMAEQNIKYDGSLAMNSVEFFGLPTISCGVTKPKGNEYEILVSKNEIRKSYKKIVLKDNKIVGFVLVGDVNKAGVYGSLIRKKVDVSSVKEQLLSRRFDFAKILPFFYSHQSEIPTGHNGRKSEMKVVSR